MTTSRMTLTWHFCGGWVLQKVDIILLDFLSMVTTWSVSNIGNTSILI